MPAKGQLKHVFSLQAQKQGSYMVVYSIFMTIIALGVVVGFSFLVSSSPTGNELLYLSTGAPTIVLIMTALVVVPMQNATARVAGYIDFIKSLPVSRKYFLFADVTIWAIITVPAIVVSVLVAHFMFHPGFSISWTILPVYLLVVASCFGIGYGYSFAMPSELAMALSQVIAFVALMFSPINFPIERLPEWLQIVHTAFPLYHMAQVMRASLAHDIFQAHMISYVVLAAWTVIGFFGAIRVLERS